LTYVALLIFGFIGLFVMAAMGSLRSGHHAGGRGHTGLARGARSVGRHAARGPHPQSAGRASGKLGSKAGWLLQGLSPIDIMAMAMGAGALGIVGRKVFHDETIAALMAIAGAVFIDLLVVRPIFNMLLRFASQPSSGLEGMISQTAEAATTFDAQGRGLIRIMLDGQTSQVLANLEQGELEAGVRVKKGDELVVLEVDAARNICRVSREIATSD
jgi:hypothetical protein